MLFQGADFTRKDGGPDVHEQTKQVSYSDFDKPIQPTTDQISPRPISVKRKRSNEEAGPTVKLAKKTEEGESSEGNAEQSDNISIMVEVNLKIIDNSLNVKIIKYIW